MMKLLAGFVAIGVAMSLLMPGVAAAQDRLTPHTDGENFHIFPSVTHRNEAPPPPDSGPLLYNGGPVMQAGVTPYIIYWVPTTLQNGNSTTLTAHYQTVQKNMLGDYMAHGIDNNNTQYYQIVGTKTTYIQNKGNPAISFLDTNAYPASGCTDAATPGNCITDAQLVTEIQRVMALKGWTGGLSKMFFVFTSTGEGSCFTSASSSCAYTQYCAYHSFFTSGSTPVVYGNEPYGDPNFCQVSGTPSPNSDIPADTAATAASHELTEAITDPELDAWFTAVGNEIGDLCAYNYGALPYLWDAGKANQMWSGRFYMLQTEFNNATKSCVRVGP